MRKSKPRYDLLAVITVIVFAVPFFGGYATASHFAANRAAQESDAASYRLDQVLDAAEKYKSEADGLKQLTIEQSATIEALRELTVEQSATIRSLQARPASSPVRSPKPRTATITTVRASVGGWGELQTRNTLASACDRYGISGADKAWVIENGTAIAYRESHHNPSAKNGSHLGLYQFNADWGSASDRLNGTWSCYRFVRVFRDGGKAKVRQHWAATI